MLTQSLKIVININTCWSTQIVGIWPANVFKDAVIYDLSTWADHLIPGLIFFSGKLYYVAKWQQSGTCRNSVQVYVQNRRSVSPRIRSVEALG